MTGNKNNTFGKRILIVADKGEGARLASFFSVKANAVREDIRLKNKALEIEKQSVITQYLNGKTVNQIASQNALTREFVRNAIFEYNNSPKAHKNEDTDDSDSRTDLIEKLDEAVKGTELEEISNLSKDLDNEKDEANLDFDNSALTNLSAE